MQWQYEGTTTLSITTFSQTTLSRHERDLRQSQSRSGEISKVSRRHFSGFWEKVPSSLIKAASKLRLGTTLNGTRAVHFFTFERSGRGTDHTQKPGCGKGAAVLVLGLLLFLRPEMYSVSESNSSSS